MKTAILCAVFFIIGAAAGSIMTGFAVNRIHQRVLAVQVTGDLGFTAIQAELIKLGESATALGTLERSIPLQVLAIHENEALRSAATADSAFMSAKRFYVCTKTPIPAEIEAILENVSLNDNACEPNAGSETAPF